MVRFLKSSGFARVMWSYKPYVVVVLLGYSLLIILLFHARLLVEDEVESHAKKRSRSDEHPVTLSEHRSEPRIFLAGISNGAGISSTGADSPGAAVTGAERQASSSRDEADDSAFPLVRNCFPESSTEPRSSTNEVVFQKLGEHYLYSAYLDDRDRNRSPVIRVIALLKKSEELSFFCHVPYFVPSGKDETTDGRHHKTSKTTEIREPQGHLHKSAAGNWYGSTVGSDTDKTRAIGYGTIGASTYEMCENHNKEYGGWILSCRVPVQVQDRPCQVLISTSSSPPPDGNQSSVVTIPLFRVNNEHRNKNYTFGICVPPLFGHIPSTTLVEFVEFSRILGAERFVFYHHEVSTEIAKALGYYVSRGFVTTIRWDLPVESRHVWYHGQLVAINDCLYRSMHAFRYLTFNDVDEFIVPHVQLTWTEMISHFRRMLEQTSTTKTQPHGNRSLHFDEPLKTRGNDLQSNEDKLVDAKRSLKTRGDDLQSNNQLVEDKRSLKTRGDDLRSDDQLVEGKRSLLTSGVPPRGLPRNSSSNVQDYVGYSFQSSFFDPLLSGLISHVMYDLESDLRTKTFSKVRSKVMIRPEAIFELGIHHVSRTLNEQLQVYHVPTTLAFVHHYRKCVNEFDPMMNCQIYAHDQSLSRFIPTIRHNIHQTLWQMKEADASDRARGVMSQVVALSIRRSSADLQDGL